MPDGASARRFDRWRLPAAAAGEDADVAFSRRGQGLSEVGEKGAGSRTEGRMPPMNDPQGPRQLAACQWPGEQRSRRHFSPQGGQGQKRNAGGDLDGLLDVFDAIE